MRRTYVGLMMAGLLGCGDSGAASAGDTTTDSGTSADSSSSTPTEASTSGSGSSSSTGAAVTCTSNKYWTMGDLESPLMHPGRACLACHQTIVGEDITNMLAIAGTVYPTVYEEDECYGVDGAATPMTVEITTADGVTLKLPVNASGNFMYDQLEFGAIMFPIQAKVVQGDMERIMATPQATGDCNSCHTETGMNGAPGRIFSP